MSRPANIIVTSGESERKPGELTLRKSDLEQKQEKEDEKLQRAEDEETWRRDNQPAGESLPKMPKGDSVLENVVIFYIIFHSIVQPYMK